MVMAVYFRIFGVRRNCSVSRVLNKRIQDKLIHGKRYKFLPVLMSFPVTWFQFAVCLWNGAKIGSLNHYSAARHAWGQKQ